MDRNTRLDILRIIAISLVVIMHSPRPYSNSSYVLLGVSYLTAPGLVLFFMISGALLLNNNFSAKEFLRRRFKKIVYPTLFWSVLFIMMKYVNGEDSLGMVLKSCLNIPLHRQGNGALWFMYTLSGLYLLTPILSTWLKTSSKREIEFYLAIWGITLLFPYLKIVLQVNESETGILYYFAGYVGYFLLGYYLRFYYVFKHTHVLVAIFVALFVPSVIFFTQVKLDFYSVLWYLSLPVALMAFLWFILINRMPNVRNEWISKAANLSFGVYFLHILIIREFLWNISYICDIPGPIQLIVIPFVTLIISFFITWIISLFPYSKYIIGI